MKNNSWKYLVLIGMLTISTACQQTANVNTPADIAVATSDTNSTADINAMMTSRMKGSMKESSPDAANAPYDLQFLDTMSAHHQSAVDMAKTVVAKSSNAELKSFAAKIIRDQNKEIAQMKNWRGKWFAEKPPAMNMEMPGMMDSMRSMNMKKLEAGGGKLFDLRFLNMMIPHHQGAITMSKEASDKAEHAEIKTLANQIIKSQEEEIKKMQEWKTAWGE